MFLRIGFTNWNIIEKYFERNCLCGLSTKNDLLGQLHSVRVEAQFYCKAKSFIYFRLLFRLLAVLLDIFNNRKWGCVISE